MNLRNVVWHGFLAPTDAQPELAALAMGEMGAAMLDHADRSRRAAAAGAQPPPASTPRVQLLSLIHI